MNMSKPAMIQAIMILALASPPAVYAAPRFDPDSQPVGYVGQPGLTSPLVKSGSELLYSIDYNVTDWSGNLHAYPVTATGLVSLTDRWTGGAAKIMDLRDWNTSRRIVTMNGSSKITFRWANLSAAQKTALDPATAVAATSSPVLDYIRGDRSNESPNGKTYRTRSTVLGDIIHSTPAYWDDGTNKTVFIGSNDGMLHAIHGEDGTERFAYIPSMLISKLPALTANPYVHKYFVDGRMDIRNFGGTTILAGALGSGGKGLFALDVTNAAVFDEVSAASKILWEISDSTSGFGNLGYTYGQPVLAILPGGTNVLIVNNGYNNTGNGHAVLYVINPATGAKIAEIDTGSGSISSPNGLSSPAVVYDNGAHAILAYAGDIDGNLWKFDLVANTSSLLHAAGQAITSTPGYIAHPNGGYMVTFATGRMLTAADEIDASTQYAYGIWDRPAAYSTNDTLLTQTLTESNYTLGGSSLRVRTATNTAPDWTAGAGKHKGWKTALPNAGERVVGEGASVSETGQFVFLASNPTVSPSATPPGENWWMQLNALTGGENRKIVFDLNLDSVYNSSDAVSAGKPVGRHIGGGVRSQLIQMVSSTGLVSVATYDKNGDPPASEPPVRDGPGVSGGHFDFDIYYYGAATATTNTPTAASETKSVCASERQVLAQKNTVATLFCKTPTFSPGYGYMTAYSKGLSCGGRNNTISITCNTYTTSTVAGSYANKQHVHQYDDKFDVTGVNMLNASAPAFNLSPNVISSTTATTPEFKILVMNQFLNPAAKLSVGGAAEVNVKTYNNLASETNATTLLAGLPIYSRNTVNTLVFNLPMDAFKSKNWWGTGGDDMARAGLMPTQTGCVNRVNADGSMPGNSGRGAREPNGERFNGALTIQIIKASTPASALEVNHNGSDVRYGWRVKIPEFRNYVIAEYTAFWHHPNGACYGQVRWVANAPEVVSRSTPPAAGSTQTGADPKDGIFSVGGPSPSPSPAPAPAPAPGTGTGMTTGGEVGPSGGVGGVIIEPPSCPPGEICKPSCPPGALCNSPPPCTQGMLCSLYGPVGRTTWREVRE